MTLPTMDFETYSEAGHVWSDDKNRWTSLPNAPQGKKGLPIVGVDVYAEHPTTDILTMTFDLADGVGPERWRPGLPLPWRLFQHLAAGRPIECHNAMFERRIWECVAVRRYGFPPLPPAQMRCSMATARTNNLPGALAKLGEVLAVDVQKDRDGKRLLDKFSVPRNPTKADARRRIRPEDDPADAERLYGYCDTDVAAEQQCADRMEPMAPAELAFWLIDQEINHRGLGVDRAAIRDCIAVLGQALEQYGRECEHITGGLQPGQLKEVTGWLAGQGVRVPDMQADTVEMMLRKPDLPGPARRVLEIRSLIGSASVKKLFAMEYQASADNRLRNLIVHHGARTGRPTGEGPQPLNLPKAGPALVTCGACGKPHKHDVDACPWCAVPAPPVERKRSWKAAMVDPVLEIMASRSLGLVEWFFGDALLAIQGCVRGTFVADDDSDLIASDYSAIEAVVAAQISGEQWRIDTLHARKDIYLASASKITGITYDAYIAWAAEHGENHPDRQKVGKIAELACITPHTLVLTDRGLVRMGAVTRGHKVWDGNEWVAHGGLVERGRRPTINVDGVEMTSHHRVISGRWWREAGRLVSSPDTLSQALASGSANLPFGAPKEANETARSRCRATAALRHTSSRGRTFGAEKAPLARSARRQRVPRTGNGSGATRTLSPMRAIAVGCSIESRPASLGANRMAPQTTEVEVSACLPDGRSVSKVGAPFSATLSGCRAGTIHRWKWIASIRKATMNRATFGSHHGRKGRNARFGTFKPSSTTTRRVCDIADAGPRSRFTIKTNTGWLIVHNCGYGGWEGAWRAFDPDADNKTSDQICATIKEWRGASPQIVAHWGGQRYRDPRDGRWYDGLFGIEGAVIAAIQTPGSYHVPQPPPGIAPFPVDIGFYVRDDILRMVLPSGREIKYWNPRLAPSTKRAGTLAISYNTWNSNPKYGALGWVRMDTWGSRIYENADQAIAHDILRFAIINLRAAGYPTVLHVYDEIVVEVPKGWGSVEEVERIMSTMPPWATGWPVRAAGGWRGRRYRKG